MKYSVNKFGMRIYLCINALVATFVFQIQAADSKPYVPDLPDTIVDEVANLLDDATRTSQWDFSNVESVDKALVAQQRIRDIGELADWALIAIYEKYKNAPLGRKALKVHMYSNSDLIQAEYGLWTSRNTIMEAIQYPTERSRSSTIDVAASYLGLWGEKDDLKLLGKLVEVRNAIGQKSNDIQGSLLMLSRRITQQLPPGQADVVTSKKIPFHRIEIKPEHVASLKNLVALTNERQVPLKSDNLNSITTPNTSSDFSTKFNSELNSNDKPVDNLSKSQQTSSYKTYIIVVAISFIILILGVFLKKQNRI